MVYEYNGIKYILVNEEGLRPFEACDKCMFLNTFCTEVVDDCSETRGGYYAPAE